MAHLSAFKFSYVWNIVSVLSLVLSIWAIKLALKQGAESREQSITAQRLFGEQTQLIRYLEGLVSTRSIGFFPEYLTSVAALLRTAESSIRIMTLISSHGSYTAEERWLEVKQAIEQQGARKEKTKSTFVLELITSTPGTFRRTFEHIHPAFRKDQSWENWKRDEEENHDFRLSRFLQKCKFSKSVKDLSVADYYDARLKEHQDVLDDVFWRWGTLVYECDPTLPLYCYLVDDQRAIFSIPTQDMNGRYAGVGISTEEPYVASALLNLFEHYRRMSMPPAKDQPRLRQSLAD